MDRAFTQLEEREETSQQLEEQHYQLKLCVPTARLRSYNSNFNTFSLLGFWVSKSIRNLYNKARFSNRFRSKRLEFNGMVVNNSAFCESPASIRENKGAMERLIDKNSEGCEEKKGTFGENGGQVESFGELIEENGRECSSSYDFLTSETTEHEEERSDCSSEEESSSPPPFGWPVQKDEVYERNSTNGATDDGENPHLCVRQMEKQGSSISEIEMMKERLSKLLLGEDMSGCGNGVCTALTISNAITNLSASLFGQLWRLEPLPPEKKVMWRREMEMLLCVSDHIVELIPSWQTFPGGSKLEVMTYRPRSDLYVNLPALRKLDNMLLEILDSFDDTEFWYVEQGILAPEADGSSSFRRALQRQEEKWWLPVPQVPPGGLHDNVRKQLQHKRDCTNQILKTAVAINNVTLADIEVPEYYMETLPKNGKASLRDFIHRYISSEQFSPECLLDCLDLSSEHLAIELANRMEASIYIWRKGSNGKPVNNVNRSVSKSSWDIVKDLVVDGEKRELLADRAETLLLCLKQRFPGLPQTALDMSKIQYNKDVGKSILESYSRVIESLAFNIVARIDDLLYVDDLTKHTDQYSSINVIGHNSIGIAYSVPVISTPYKTAFTTPSFSPAHQITPKKGDRSPYMTSGKIPQRGSGVKKVLTDYLNIEMKAKDSYIPTEGTDKTNRKASPIQPGVKIPERKNEAAWSLSPPAQDSVV